MKEQKNRSTDGLQPCAPTKATEKEIIEANVTISNNQLNTEKIRHESVKVVQATNMRRLEIVDKAVIMTFSLVVVSLITFIVKLFI